MASIPKNRTNFHLEDEDLDENPLTPTKGIHPRLTFSCFRLVGPFAVFATDQKGFRAKLMEVLKKKKPAKRAGDKRPIKGKNDPGPPTKKQKPQKTPKTTKTTKNTKTTKTFKPPKKYDFLDLDDDDL